MKNRIISCLLMIVLLISLLPAALAEGEGCAHSYLLQADSFEATDTTGGYRHYKCAACGDEYDYTTDPLVYAVNPKTGEPVTLTNAINPYLPNWEFMPDNELHVFWSKADSEWRVYAVGSHDTKLSGWCGNDITCWSAPVYDLTDWRFEALLRDTGWFFACDFNYDLTTDRAILYAFPFFGNPELEGTHLWVNGHSVPDAPFTTPLTEDGGVVGLDGVLNFDPSILIEADGTILCTYDATDNDVKHAQLSKVNADRTGLEWSVPVIMAEGEPNSAGYNPKNYEGTTIDKVEVDGHWYWVIQYSYKSNWSEDDYEKDVDGEQRYWPLAYVYSDPDMAVDELKDFTGWHWGGLIADNGGFLRRDPGSDEVTDHADPVFRWGNNHGGLVKINGQWLISNHRHTSTGAGRQGYLRTIDISVVDGKLLISPTEYTTSIGDSIDAYQTLSAYTACHLLPSIFSEVGEQTMYIETPLRNAAEDYWQTIYTAPEQAEHMSPVVGIFAGCELGYKYLDFGTAAQQQTLSILVTRAPEFVDGSVDVYLDAPDAALGTKVASFELTAAAIEAAGTALTGPDGTQWSKLTSDIETPISGVHAVYFVFASEAEGTICSFDEFAFN